MTRKNLIFATLLLMITVTVSAYQNYTYNKNPELRKELMEYISITNVTSQIDQPFTVIYLVNSDREIVVVDTSNEKMAEFIKNALNYKSIKTSNFEVNKIYILTLKIFKSKLVYN